MDVLLYAPPAVLACGSKSGVRARRVSCAEELADVCRLRKRVFVDEMSIPVSVESDEHDKSACSTDVLHYIAQDSLQDKPIGACRVRLLDDGSAKLERVAVACEFRKRGVGGVLLSAVLGDARVSSTQGPLFCHSMESTVDFYCKNGWVREAGHGALVEGGIKHAVMLHRRCPAGRTSESLSHIMVRTKDIVRARKFYSLLGFRDISRFITGGVRAAWMQSPFIDVRLELMETDTTGGAFTNPASNPFGERKAGLGHLSFDVTRSCTSLSRFLETVERDSIAQFRKTLRILRETRQEMIGTTVAEVAFIADADGTVIELMRKQCVLSERPQFDEQW